MLTDLKWLGINWDEGEGSSGRGGGEAPLGACSGGFICL